MMSSPLRRRVLIVEDDVFVGGLLRESLQSAGFDSHHVTSTATARHAAIDFDPDVALIDVDLGEGPSGIDLARVFARTRPELVMVMLTSHPSDSVRASLPPHVGFIKKSFISEPSALQEAVDSALRRGGGNILYDDDGPHPFAALSASQREVLRLLAMGLSNSGIAKARGVTQSGAEQAVSSVFRALGLAQNDTLIPRVEAVRLYIEAYGVPGRSHRA